MFSHSLFTHAAIAFIASVLATAYLVPKIISIVRFKKLMDNPNERSSHSSATPSLGGMAFFIVLIISMYFNHGYDTFGVATSIYPALTVIFFLGLKDDLLVLAPRTKLIGQTLAALFILMNVKFEITSFHGFFGIGEVNQWVGIAVGVFLMLAIINAFNLIDGIDGLASSVGIVAFSGFALVYFMAGRYFFCLTSLVMVGILIGFLFFNLSSRNKIFMGDTGSMLIGFMLGVMSIRFLSLDQDSIHKLPFNAIDIPIVIISFLIIPLFDAGRVFTIRLINGKGVFTADRNHLHHVLIDAYEISHRRASFYIATANIICVVIFSIVMKVTNVYITSLLIVVFVVLSSLFLYELKRSVKKKKVLTPVSDIRRIKRIKLYRIGATRSTKPYRPKQHLPR